MNLNPNASIPTIDPQLAGHPEFQAVMDACPPGTDSTPAKPTKAVSKVYFVARDEISNVMPDPAVGEEGFSSSWDIVGGSEDGFRTKEEVNRFVRTLPPGEYTLLVAHTKKIVVEDVRRVKGV